MNSFPSILHLLCRILRGEKFRKATPEELRTYGASLSLGGAVLLIFMSLDRDTWLLPPTILCTWAVLALIPLAIFLLWVHEYARPVHSMAVSISIAVPAVVLCFLSLRVPLPMTPIAQCGLIVYTGLILTRSAGRKVPQPGHERPAP